MNLEASALLPAETSSVPRARRLVRSLFEGAVDDERVEIAQLLVSETVTNAVLHAGTEIHVRCFGQGDVIRIEVEDGSAIVPTARNYGVDATTGRGVALVESLSSRWGVASTDTGKVVWFEITSATPTGSHRPTTSTDVAVERFPVRLVEASPLLVRATIEYGDAVLRELALAALDEDSIDVLPDGWHLPQIDVAPVLDAAREAEAAVGHARCDLEFELTVGSGSAGLERLRLIDAADARARAGEMLLRPALPEIGLCRQWIYTQIAEQEGGAPAIAWDLPVDPLLVPTERSGGDLLHLLPVTEEPVVVADDAHRIVAVSDSAAQLLGWDRDALVGQRLTIIVPPELREAHLAGFSRLLLSRAPRILGVPVDVPALRRDGSRVQVRLSIAEVDLGVGRTAYHATLEPTAENAEGVEAG